MREFRALIVDDHEGFRQFLRRALEEQTHCQIIGEVSNGLEAVEKARELHPDLILLDLGLPRLNGMEAARRIVKLRPDSKILFVTQDTSPDVVEGALRMGACGYLLKSDAVELARAVDEVLHGRQFVSSSLNGKNRP